MRNNFQTTQPKLLLTKIPFLPMRPKFFVGTEGISVELVAYTPQPDKVIAESASISHSSKFKKLDENKVKYLINLLKKLGHESVFEHASFTFKIEGISRVCTHQLVRHRIASYTQQSQRYVLLKDIEFIVPEDVQKSKFLDEFIEIAERAYELYRKMVRSGIKKEDARYILPHGVSTKIVVTMNARELRHFFRLRCEKDAQWEIRTLAIKMLEKCYEVAPITFEDLYRKYVIGE